MKIKPAVWSDPVTATGDARTPKAPPSPSGDRSTRVTLSPAGQWVASVKEAAAKSPEIRQDVVEATRAAIANGTYEQSVDLDAVVGRLLEDV